MGDHDLHWVSEPPQLDAPILVVMLTGWIDATGAAKAAASAILDDIDATPLVRFDDDIFIDYRARRPTLSLVDGLHASLTWSHIELSVGRDQTGRDLLILTGPEPDMVWHRFTRHIGELADRFGVSHMAHLGAYPFAVPHTRAARLSVTSPSNEVLASVPFLRSSVDVPAGMAISLEREMDRRGIPALGIWAQVPHYVNQMSYPAASVALLEGLRKATGVVVDAAELRNDVIVEGRRLDELVAKNDEHRNMVAQLEQIYDASDGEVPIEAARPLLEMTSGDELAAEFQKYLRGDS